MGSATVGGTAAIMIGGIAGWLAEQLQERNERLMNIVLGIIGAAIASAQVASGPQ